MIGREEQLKDLLKIIGKQNPKPNELLRTVESPVEEFHRVPERPYYKDGIKKVIRKIPPVIKAPPAGIGTGIAKAVGAGAGLLYPSSLGEGDDNPTSSYDNKKFTENLVKKMRMTKALNKKQGTNITKPQTTSRIDKQVFKPEKNIVPITDYRNMKGDDSYIDSDVDDIANEMEVDKIRHKADDIDVLDDAENVLDDARIRDEMDSMGDDRESSVDGREALERARLQRELKLNKLLQKLGR